jgi:hypothetical protein
LRSRGAYLPINTPQGSLWVARISSIGIRSQNCRARTENGTEIFKIISPAIIAAREFGCGLGLWWASLFSGPSPCITKTNLLFAGIGLGLKIWSFCLGATMGYISARQTDCITKLRKVLQTILWSNTQKGWPQMSERASTFWTYRAIFTPSIELRYGIFVPRNMEYFCR